MNNNISHGLKEAAKEHLLSGQPLTLIEGMFLYGIKNVPELVRDLRGSGDKQMYNILTLQRPFSDAHKRMNEIGVFEPLFGAFDDFTNAEYRLFPDDEKQLQEKIKNYEDHTESVSLCESWIYQGNPICNIEAFFRFGIKGLPQLINSLKRKNKVRKIYDEKVALSVVIKKLNLNGTYEPPPSLCAMAHKIKINHYRMEV